MKFVLALDFDGTLWDSVYECFVMTCEAFKALQWEIPPIENLEEKFRRGRCYVLVGADFYNLMRWIIQNPKRDPLSMALTEEKQISQPNKEALRFEEKFYECRTYWGERRFEEWSKLQHPYPGILEQIKILEKQFNKVVIATTKDEASVQRLMTPYQLSLDIFGKEKSTDKVKQMQLISQHYQTPLSRIVFVDDILEQVMSVSSLGVHATLAGWGYNSPEQQVKAEKLNIPIVQIQTLAESLGRIARLAKSS